MEDSSCLMQMQQPFSYVSGLAINGAKEQPNKPFSISSNGFLQFSSQKRYVEEAQRYAQPGSVAQKKAFFEAHYKELAARKASNDDLQTKISGSKASVQEHESKVVPSTEPGFVFKANMPDSNQVLDSADNKEVAVMELTGTSSEPSLKDSVSRKKKLVFSTFWTSIHSRPSKAASSPAKPVASVWPKRKSNVTPMMKESSKEYSDNRKSSPKSTHKSMIFTPAREFSKLTSAVTRKIENSRYGASLSKACQHPLATPRPEKRRAKTDLYPVSDNKPVGSSWCFLSTELQETLCFKARTLPDFYKDESKASNETAKVPTSILTARFRMDSINENASPNIQHR